MIILASVRASGYQYDKVPRINYMLFHQVNASRVTSEVRREPLAVSVRNDAIIDYDAIIDDMPAIIIRNLDETTKRKLKIRAAMNGRSMEQEAREILKRALAQTSKKNANLAERIRAIFAPLGGVELERLPREPIRDPDWLGERE